VRKTDRDSLFGRALGSFGLLLLGLTGWAVERLQGGAPVEAVLARLVLEGVTAVGKVVDRLPSAHVITQATEHCACGVPTKKTA
jgi:hypothetical protein